VKENRRLRRRVARLETIVEEMMITRPMGGRVPNGLLSSLLGEGTRKRPLKSYWCAALYYGKDKPGSSVHNGDNDVIPNDVIEAHNKSEAREQLRALVEAQGKDPNEYELRVEEA
jgi:hypothetical protein